MASAEPKPLAQRAAFVRGRVRELAATTGMTKMQVLEEAVRAFNPIAPAETGGRLIRKGRFLLTSSYDGQPVTLEQTNAAIEAIRSGERD